MDVILRIRQKCKAEEVEVGQCFREIQKTRCLQVIDLTKVDMFQNPKEGENPILRNDVVYVADVATGIVDIIPKNQEVYRVVMRAEEVG